jgi:hypothetical protein
MNTPISARSRRRFVATWPLVVALATVPAGRALGQNPVPKRAVAISPFSTTTNDPLKIVNTTSGFGAVANSARAGGNAAGVGADLSPSATEAGKPFDNTVTLPGMNGAKIQALTPLQTTNVGNRLLDAYPQAPPLPPPAPQDAQGVGQSIKYFVDSTTDKVTPALNNGEFVLGGNSLAVASAGKTDAFADGSMTVAPNAKNNKAVDVNGAAMARVTYDNPLVPNGANQKAFAVSFLRDPVTYTLTSPGSSATVVTAIGSTTSLFSLQATEPGMSATALYDLSTDRDGTLVSFNIGIDNTTKTLDQVSFNVDALSPLLGFASVGDFERYILSFLTLDPNQELLSASAGIPLYQVPLGPSSPTVTVSFTAGGIVAAALPVPSSVVPFGLGLLGLLGARLVTRRGRQLERPVAPCDGDPRGRSPSTQPLE